MFNIESFIKTFSYVGIFAAVFAESGLLIGFLLPGDSLLFLSGFLASQGYLNIELLIIGVFIAAVLGDNAGYLIGVRIGPRLFNRPSSRWLSPDQLKRAEQFFDRYGGKTIVLARFTPVVRTIAPMMAGMGEMTYSQFFLYNVLGALLWAVGICLLGYFLGSTIPDIDKYILPAIAVVILISITPGLFHFLRVRKRSKS